MAHDPISRPVAGRRGGGVARRRLRLLDRLDRHVGERRGCVPGDVDRARALATTPATVSDTEPAAACSEEAILPVLQSLFPENEVWDIVDVQIADCRNGYARVFAVPDTSSCADPDVPCLENEQVYLRDAGGAWVYVDSGTGVECGNPEGLLPETLEACEALGLLP